MVKLLLWNVDLTPDLSISSPLRDSKKRYPKIAQVINEYDIVVLNECFLYRNELLQMVVHKYQFTDPKPWYKFFNSGVVILSKYPFHLQTYYHFKHNSYWDKPISKGVLKATFAINENKLFDLYGTHMQQYNDQAAHSARLEQVGEIINFVNETRISDPNNPNNLNADIILVGDLNMGPVSDKTYKTYPVHYSNSEDAKLRDAQYNSLIQGLELTNYVAENDICHLLHNGTCLKIKRLEIPDYKLSDTGAYCIEF